MADDVVVPARARIADALTGSRFVLAVLLIPVAAAGAWRPAAVLVAAAWWSDYLDGKVARSTAGTRLGRWDPHADTAVGIGIVTGLSAGGWLPVGWLLLAVGFGAIFVLKDNFAFGELAQAVGYGALLWLVRGDLVALTVLVATILAIAILDADRFVTHTLPAFFEGIGWRRCG